LTGCLDRPALELAHQSARLDLRSADKVLPEIRLSSLM
jgi:hypothetical protein